MNRKSVATVVLLTIVTFSIYSISWFVASKDEMNEKFGTQIPTGWMMIVPIANIIWMWKWAEGVPLATNGKQSQGTAFILVFLLGVVGMAILQSEFNKATNGLPRAFAVG